MKKIVSGLVCAALCGTMVFAAACNKSDHNDPESRALGLSISALDGNFNPFYYTSQTDGQVISMTQASLITSEVNGTVNGKLNVDPVAGENYPTVAKDYAIKFYDKRVGGNVVQDSALAANGGRTEYEFLIKNDMKFSDGTPLTIKDVLFNFYVYLDPVYTGSNTMYSVDIQGLTAYQNNNSNLKDGESGNDDYFYAAQDRLQELIRYGKGEIKELSTQGKKDYEKVKAFYKEELTTDWSAVETSWVETYKTNYTFTAAWQAYLFSEGVVTAQTRQREDKTIREIRVNEKGNEIDPNDKEAYNAGKILTTLDQWAQGAYQGDYPRTGNQTEITAIEGLTTEEALNSYMKENNCDKDTAFLEITKEYCINRVFDINLGNESGLDEVLQYWATGTTAYNYFLADERGNALKNSTKPQYYIEGIQTKKVTSFTSSQEGPNKGVEYQLDGEYDVLKIVINDVDPAAIWQFGISIAPLHYYSGKYENYDYVANFNGDQNNGKGSGDENTCFGVKRGELDFFTEVVQGTDTGKSGVPVGAGPYKASTDKGGTASSKGQFLNSNIVYYERNSHFETMGANIENAKIKYLRYKVLDDDRIITSVLNGSIDYGEPNATPTNNTTVTANKGKLGTKDYDTSGYGYVGINPTFVPDIEIRKIIMSAMNTSLALSYYGEYASPLFRPMSRTSWAYPDSAQAYYKSAASSTEIENKLRALGYQKNGSGIYEKDGHQLKYTFTIAGANSDHPAYNMFNDAAKLLNQAGFSISVKNDPNALLALTRGGLAVWAAAWSSGVDPDMYQVYHKDSQATNVLNWGYRNILNDTTGKYGREQNIIEELSDLIDQGRETLDKDRRTVIYNQCLTQVMELAVELPIYQRKDLCIYNKNVIDESTLNKSPNAYTGVIDRIWEVNYR